MTNRTAQLGQPTSCTPAAAACERGPLQPETKARGPGAEGEGENATHEHYLTPYRQKEPHSLLNVLYALASEH